MSEIVIRHAVLADAEALAQVHVQAWDESYRAFAPAEVFEKLNFATRLNQWTMGLKDAPQWPIVLVAEESGTIIGFISASPAPHSHIHPHIMIRTLYVLESHKRRGLGRRLMGAMVKELLARSITGIGLGVLDENTAGIAFYEALGGQQAGEEINPGPVWKSREILYVWDDLPALSARCG